jgi:hypothetical protein
MHRSQEGAFHNHRDDNSEKVSWLIGFNMAITDMEKMFIGSSRDNRRL